MVFNNFGFVKEIFWCVGVNENMIIKFFYDVKVQGKILKVGKYGFYMIFKESGVWILIFNKNISVWGSYFYDEVDDVLCVEVILEKLDYMEWLIYEFIDCQVEFIVLVLKWENFQILFKIELLDVKELYVEII